MPINCVMVLICLLRMMVGLDCFSLATILVLLVVERPPPPRSWSPPAGESLSLLFLCSVSVFVGVCLSAGGRLECFFCDLDCLDLSLVSLGRSLSSLVFLFLPPLSSSTTQHSTLVLRLSPGLVVFSLLPTRCRLGFCT